MEIRHDRDKCGPCLSVLIFSHQRSCYNIVIFFVSLWPIADSAFRISWGRGETNLSTAPPLTCSKFYFEVISYLIELTPVGHFRDLKEDMQVIVRQALQPRTNGHDGAPVCATTFLPYSLVPHSFPVLRALLVT